MSVVIVRRKRAGVIINSGGVPARPGGSDTDVQFNDAGAFEGSGVKWNKTANVLGFGGTSAAEPGFQRSGTSIAVRRADGTGFVPILPAQVALSGSAANSMEHGAHRVETAGKFEFQESTKLEAPANGKLSVANRTASRKIILDVTESGELRIFDSDGSTYALVRTGRDLTGATADNADFPLAQTVSSQADTGSSDTSLRAGVVGEASSDSASGDTGVGVFGYGAIDGIRGAAGVQGEGVVPNSSDSGIAFGVTGASNDAHTGGINVGMYATADNGASNYALWLGNGDVWHVGATGMDWALRDNDAAALEFTAGAGGAVLLALDTTNGSEGVGLARVGFNGTPPQAKPTVTGSKGGNAALASLITALANLGLITDSTT